MRDLGKRVAKARDAKGMRQADLARAIDVTPQTISQLEKGAVRRPKYILPIARALGVNPHWLETGQGQMIPGNDAAPSILSEIDIDLLVIAFDAAERASKELKLSRRDTVKAALLNYDILIKSKIHG